LNVSRVEVDTGIDWKEAMTEGSRYLNADAEFSIDVHIGFPGE
jgi:hypothetical protein